uniref:Uncharacterized protein LOC105135486 n=1 Tax=Rhizophora mucronata TaxID=61149 RepID=A0A2P2KVD9_RHIMU
MAATTLHHSRWFLPFTAKSRPFPRRRVSCFSPHCSNKVSLRHSFYFCSFFFFKSLFFVFLMIFLK